jgi:hypothetical protein
MLPNSVHLGADGVFRSFGPIYTQDSLIDLELIGNCFFSPLQAIRIREEKVL